MPTVDPEQEKLLYKGLNFLGQPTSIGMTGSEEIPAGAAGLPAPSGVGGLSGFQGGSGVISGRPGVGGRPDEGLTALGKAVEGIKKLYGMQGPGPTRGDTGGQSLSDRLRSGEATPGSNVGNMLSKSGYGTIGADMLPLPGTQVQPTFNAQGIPVSGFGEVSPGATDMTLTNVWGAGGGGASAETINALLEAGFTPDMIQEVFGGAEQALTGGAMPAGAAQVGTSALSNLAGGLAAGGAGALVGALPGLITSQLTNDPLANTLASQAGAVGGVAATGAITGALSGTGAAAGAGASLAAAAPVAWIAAPYLVAQLVKAWQGHADAGNIRELKNRVENIYGQLPGELQTLMKIPEIASQLNESSTPEQAASVLKQLNDMQSQYQSQGWESHRKTGATGVRGVGQDFSAQLPGVQDALASAEAQVFPTLDMARMRAQDMLQKAGWTPEQIQQQTGRYLTPQEQALSFGSRAYYKDPESGSGVNAREYNPWMQANYIPGVDVPSTQIVGAGGEGGGGMEQTVYNFQPPTWSPEAQAAFAGIQPGGTEAALRGLFGQVQGANQFGWNPLFAAGPPAASQPGSIGAQINALLGGGGGTGLEEGLLPEEVRRRLGQ